MNQRTIFLTLAGTLGLIVILAWVARPGVSQNEPSVEGTSVSAGTLEVKESTYDFGTISMKAGEVSHIFKIKNVGSDPVVIAKRYLAVELGYEVRHQLNLARVVNVASAGDFRSYLSDDAEFLAQLARQRGDGGLPRLDAAAGELPLARVTSARPPAGEEDLA